MFLENLKILLLFCLMILFTCCSKGIKFDPDFRVGNHLIPGIVAEEGTVIPAGDLRFDNFACMSKEKIKELEQVLMSHKVSGLTRSLITKEYRNLNSRFNEANSRQEEIESLNGYFQDDVLGETDED